MLLESRADMEFARNVAELTRRFAGEQSFDTVNSNFALYDVLQRYQKAGRHIDQIVKTGEQSYLILYTK